MKFTCIPLKLLHLITFLWFYHFNVFNQSLDRGLSIITPEKVSRHINYLASDAMMGRKTPSAELDSIADYIAGIFKKIGLQPVNGSYFQPVPLVKSMLGDTNIVTITYNGTFKDLKIKTEFVPYEISADTTVSGQVVFAGYGITAPEYNYDDYKEINVNGKIVLILRHEPGEESDSSVFSGKRYTKYSRLANKAENAIKHGAIGMLVVTDPLNHQLLNPRGFPWPSLSKIIPKNALPVSLKEDSKKIPVVHVGKEVMEMFFGSVDSLKKIQQLIDKSFNPLSFDLQNSYATIKTSVIDSAVKSDNIVGFIEGKDPVLKNEILIVGGHYDHIGFKANHNDTEDYIFNGADDNASGTTGLITVAEAFSKLSMKPKRSVLFIAFTAEEIGLYGSEAYTRNPLFSLDKTIAMLNMDMIGRNHPDSLYLIGAGFSPDITRIIEKLNNEMGFTLVPEDGYLFEGSDHASFYHKDIPIGCFFTGLHADYHSVRDNPDLINLTKLAKVTKLIFKTAWYLSNDNKHYKIIQK